MLIPFDAPLQHGVLLRRYKRFFADVQLDDGRELTLHCPNTGSMLGCAEPGSQVWVSVQPRPGRKLPGTWELVECAEGGWACIHSARANRVVEQALQAGLIEPLAGFSGIRREVRLEDSDSRFDFLLDGADGECVVEVKSVTLALSAGVGGFPDTVSLRGQKHLRELMRQRSLGRRACLLFCVMRSGISEVRPAEGLDPHYAGLLRESDKTGVELLALALNPEPDGLRLAGLLPVIA